MAMTRKNTCMFIVSNILYDMQQDWEFENDKLQLVNLMEWLDWLADIADTIADIAVKKLDDSIEDYDVCKTAVDWYLAGLIE